VRFRSVWMRARREIGVTSALAGAFTESGLRSLRGASSGAGGALQAGGIGVRRGRGGSVLFVTADSQGETSAPGSKRRSSISAARAQSSAARRERDGIRMSASSEPTHAR